MTDKLRTIQAAAKELEVSKSTLKRWLKDGTLKEPDRIRRGKQKIRSFTDAWLDYAKEVKNKFDESEA
jgi:predicted site-specific integrase-resolvase